MSLQIQMLGTGNAFAKKYYNNNALVYYNDYTLLIDCGITAPLSLHQLNIEPNEIDGILITHQHGDHVGGLEEIAYKLLYVYKKKINLFLPEDLIKPLWENSLKGGLFNGEEGCNLNTYFNVIPLIEKQTFSIDPGLTIEIIATDHIPNKLSYSLIINNHVFYSSDMLFNPGLIEYVLKERNCKYILHECQLKGPGIVHTTLDELLSLPEAAQEIIQLMHYEDDMEDFQGKTGKMSFLIQHHRYVYP